MTKLTRYEKETIINFNQTNDPVSIYTLDASLKRRLAKFAEDYPELCRLESATEAGGVTYSLAKSRLSIRLVPPYSEARRREASEYGKRHGFQTQTDTAQDDGDLTTKGGDERGK